ncbi:GroES-like protein [Hypoxylon rubiginosum]|uniref:GroES-like protein n=1 Tax=Hypoxylon rubiginosum TaxID=110542 RepID=A0ACC0DLC4_9PEZI|nr:GroES-like protein [Hypoxylon rubiginosum]
MPASSAPPASSLPAKMKAVQVKAFNTSYEINPSAPVPTDIGPHDLLVKVAVASYCHTDSMVASGSFLSALPITASHEGAGTVVAVGSAVLSFHTGDRVMCGLPLHPCAACANCVGPDERHRQYCTATHGHVGVHIDGCLAEYVRIDARFTTRLPPEISFRAAAPLACAGRTAWGGVARAALTTGEWLVIVGAGGGLGHLAVQFAKARGLQVVAVDARDGALELARECGADIVIDARQGKDGVLAEVRRVTGEGAHASLVLSDTEGATAMAAAATRMHGTLVQVAQPKDVQLPFQELVFRDIRVRGSLLCSPDESRDMVKFIAERSNGDGGGIRVETVAFEGLDKIGELVQFVHTGKLRGSRRRLSGKCSMQVRIHRGF